MVAIEFVAMDQTVLSYLDLSQCNWYMVVVPYDSNVALLAVPVAEHFVVNVPHNCQPMRHLVLANCLVVSTY